LNKDKRGFAYMLQFYFLSIMLNLIAGMILLYGENFFNVKKREEKDISSDDPLPVADEDGKKEFKTGSRNENPLKKIFGNNTLFDDKIFRLVLGVLTSFVGLMKLLSVVHNDVPVVGDLIPALAGLSGGFSLLIEYYSENASKELELPDIIERLFVKDRKYIGRFCIAAAVLHFAFPDVILL
jgi:hypothetical protein